MPVIPRGTRTLAIAALVAGIIAAGTTGSEAHAATARPAAAVTAASAVNSTSSASGATGLATSAAPPFTMLDNSPADIYVDGASSAGCSDSGPGTETQPFCTIDEAAAVVKPGQTVVVEPGGIYAPVTISVSGTPDDPITFLGATTGVATVEGGPGTNAFLVSGAHDVLISGFDAYAGSGAAAYEITGQSSDIAVNGGRTEGLKTVPGLEIDAASNVSVTRGSFANGTGILVNPGASGVDIAGNTAISGYAPAIAVDGAPGTEIAGNTLESTCGAGIELADSSGGASIENNVLQGTCNPSSPGFPTADLTAIEVSPDSTAGTTADYNVLDPVPGSDLYDWGGADYTDLAAFTSATGQGTHDLAEDPELGSQTTTFTPGYGHSIWYPEGTPEIDSANADAPGELPTDQLGNPRADDPDVANAGAGTRADYYDRGAVEAEAGIGQTLPSVSSGGPLTAAVAVTAATSSWTTNVPPGVVDLFNFGDSPFPVIDPTATSIQHPYQTAGLMSVGIEQYFLGSDSSGSTRTQVVVGADYTPVTPTRILDTRSGTGAPKAAVAANGTLTLPVAGVAGVPPDASAVVLNVTETAATSNGYITVYPGYGTAPKVSNIDFTKGTTIPNLVTVQVADGEVSFKNGSGGSVQLVADLAGYYGPGGTGFQPKSPDRVLDTRNGTGASKQAVAANKKIQLNLSGKVPAGTTAVVLNVTVTQPKSDGWLAVYPDSGATPGTSSLNFSVNQTVANLVIVPINNGIADLYNGSGGTVQVVADLEGYFGTGGPDSFVPYGPTRLTDTRVTGELGPVQAGSSLAVTPSWNFDCPSTAACPDSVGAVNNVTVTQPTGSGYLTVYPYGTTRPVASSVNFTPGETTQGLAMTPLPAGTMSVYNGSGGTVQLVIDEYGYFIAKS